MPMVFAQTIVEAPKYGASSRTAAISAPSEPVPTTKTRMGRGGIRTRNLAGPDHPARGLVSAQMDLAAADRAYLWHPFTQQRGWVEEHPVIVDRGEGTDLIDVDGHRYIDGVSSLWCNVHGHAHPRIDAAVREQLGKVAHSTMLGLSHRPAIRLAKRLVEIAPPGLSRVFYSDSGSTATEIALKMAFQYWAQQRDGAKRAKFMTLKDAYHGDTLGSVSAGG